MSSLENVRGNIAGVFSLHGPHPLIDVLKLVHARTHDQRLFRLMMRSVKVMPVLLALVGSMAGALEAQDEEVKPIIDFGAGITGDWFVVNDGVMGGRSSSSIRITDEGFAVFQGDLSLENNGGFASVRTVIPAGALEGASRLLLRIRADGKGYQVRLRMEGRFDGVAYAASFEPTTTDWVTVAIPLESFEPTFRGYSPPDAPALDPSAVRQVGLMLTDKQVGPFRLEIAWIGVDGERE